MGTTLNAEQSRDGGLDPRPTGTAGGPELPDQAEVQRYWAEGRDSALMALNATRAGACLDEAEIEQAVWFRMFGSSKTASDDLPPLPLARRQHLNECKLCQALIAGATPSEERRRALAASLAAMAQPQVRARAIPNVLPPPIRSPVHRPQWKFAVAGVGGFVLGLIVWLPFQSRSLGPFTVTSLEEPRSLGDSRGETPQVLTNREFDQLTNDLSKLKRFSQNGNLSDADSARLKDLCDSMRIEVHRLTGEGHSIPKSLGDGEIFLERMNKSEITSEEPADQSTLGPSPPSAEAKSP